MFHSLLFKSFANSPSRIQLAFLKDHRAYSSRSGSDSEAADFDATREWFRAFNKSTIPEKLGKTEFVKAKGPGGQKVNKTNSKAVTRWDMSAIYPHVPKVLHQGLRESRYYVSSSDDIKMECDTARNQSDNKASNYQKLFDEIVSIYKKRVPGITSPEQQKRVENLRLVVPSGRRRDASEFSQMWTQVQKDRNRKRKFSAQVKAEESKNAVMAARVADRELSKRRTRARLASDHLPSSYSVLLHVDSRKKTENAARLRMKKLHGDRKRARSGGGGRGRDF